MSSVAEVPAQLGEVPDDSLSYGFIAFHSALCARFAAW